MQGQLEGTASRFQITKLEERIAPSAWCQPKGDDCRPCHSGCDDSLKVKVDIDLSLKLCL
jgi:hypothetical protein